MDPYTLFYRTRSKTDARVRWHKFDTISAPSRREAFVRAGYEYEIDQQYAGRQVRKHSVLEIDGGYPAIAMRDDEIIFDHYDFDGTFVEGSL
jgi:DUF438 domain-containing protein